MILKKSGKDARIFCFEINKKFCRHLEENITDERVIIINARAEKINENLKKFKVQKADCIISGLPFLNFSEPKKRKIIEEVKNSLNGNGKFILFQYTNGLGRLLESYFGKVERKFISLNIPPSFVYVCWK